MKILDRIFGENWREEKRNWREFQARVKALPKDYQVTYKAIQNYCYQIGLVADDFERFVDLLDLFEISAMEGISVQEIVGADVAEFCNFFFDKEGGQTSWLDDHRQSLNDYFAKR